LYSSKKKKNVKVEELSRLCFFQSNYVNVTKNSVIDLNIFNLRDKVKGDPTQDDINYVKYSHCYKKNVKFCYNFG